MARRNRLSPTRAAVQGWSGFALAGAIAMALTGNWFDASQPPGSTSTVGTEGRSQAASAVPTEGAATRPARRSVPITITSVDANDTAPPSEELLRDVVGTVQGWLDGAMVRPLESARPAVDLSPFFTPPALDRLAASPTDRAALVDEGLPPASQQVLVEAADLALSTLAASDGRVAVVLADLNLKIHAVGPTIDVDVVRTGMITLVFQDGRWKIDSYEVRVSRISRP